MRFKKTVPVSLGKTEKRRHYRSYAAKVGVVFTEDTRALYEILNQAKTLPELLREGLLTELGEDHKALLKLKRQANQSGTALAALIKRLPDHADDLRRQASELENWLTKFESNTLAAKGRKAGVQYEISRKKFLEAKDSA